MRLLLIDEESKANALYVKQYANNNKLDSKLMQKAMAGDSTHCPGDNPHHCCYFPDGFKVVYSVEEQPVGWCKHLSVSVASTDKLPHIEAVKIIMKEFDLKPLEECYCYIENSFPKSVNIISKI